MTRFAPGGQQRREGAVEITGILAARTSKSAEAAVARFATLGRAPPLSWRNHVPRARAATSRRARGAEPCVEAPSTAGFRPGPAADAVSGLS